MKLSIAAVLFASLTTLGAPPPARDLRPELEVEGRATEITVSPDGALWICTMMGHVYRSEDSGWTWGEVATPARLMTPATFLGDNLDRITFFDAQHAMISGYIGKENDRVFLTGDGGATWTEAKLPESTFWAYDARATPDGHGWLVGSNRAVYRSDDYGKSWRTLASPFSEGERTMSVWFASPEVGVVSSLFEGKLAITRDGGATWQDFGASGREIAIAGCAGQHDKRLVRTRIVDERVVIQQCGGVFVSPLAAPRRWTAVTAGGQPLVAFDVSPQGSIIGVTDEHDVAEVLADGSSRSLRMRFAGWPMSMRVSGARIALLDPTLKVAVFDGKDWRFSRMFGKGTAATWPVAVLDRGKDDVLWGVTQFFLYRSTDGAKSWERITELPVRTSAIALQDDGDVMLWDGHGWVGRWEVANGRLGHVPVLDTLDVVGSFRRRDLWLLYGGRQYDTADRVEVAQTFFSGEFTGSVPFGFVAASVDGGRSWRLIDRWEDEGLQAVFLGDDNKLTLLSWLCGVRQGTLTVDPLSAKLETLLKGTDRKKVPYVQQALVLDLLDPKHGSLLGWIHHVGNLTFATADGGRSWKGVNRKGPSRRGLYRLFDGTWIELIEPATLRRWNGKGFQPLVTIGTEELLGAWVDSRGELTLRLKDGSLRVVDGAKGEVRKLP